jgi:simple sugar transport system ATP-binding protein
MELVQVLTALRRNWLGEIEYLGKSIAPKTTAELLAEGVSCIQADRHRDGVAMGLDISRNTLLGYQQTGRFRKGRMLVDWNKVEQQARELMDEYDVRPRGIKHTLYEFSGGNQQKFVVGREMMRSPRLMIAAHPTRGVDIMATAFIHRQLLALKERGAGVLLITADLDELMYLSDRVAVLYDGSIVDCRPSGEYQTMELGRLMGGVKAHDVKKRAQ